jgi:hypothetical protein
VGEERISEEVFPVKIMVNGEWGGPKSKKIGKLG